MNFGERTRTLFADPRWRVRDGDKYPSDQCFADELELLLDFAAKHGQLDWYSSRLVKKPRERSAAIAELSVAYDLCARGFHLLSFEPLGLNCKKGEFLVSPARETVRVFVEVKAPDWQAEVTGFGTLAHDPSAQQRLTEKKYRDGDGGPILPGVGVQFAIEKAYEKLPPDQPTLLIVPSNGMFNSYEHFPQMIAHRLLNNDGPFVSSKFERLGGVGLFWYQYIGTGIRYDMEVIPNPHAAAKNTLPQSVCNLLHQRLPKKQALSVGEAADGQR